MGVGEVEEGVGLVTLIPKCLLKIFNIIFQFMKCVLHHVVRYLQKQLQHKVLNLSSNQIERDLSIFLQPRD